MVRSASQRGIAIAKLDSFPFDSNPSSSHKGQNEKIYHWNGMWKHCSILLAFEQDNKTWVSTYFIKHCSNNFSSGLCEETYGPRNVLDGREAFPSENDALSEMDEIMFGTLDNLFTKTGVPHRKSTYLSLMSPCFHPPPVIFSDYKQRLFKTYKNQFAIVVSTESISTHWYCGKEKSMVLSNCLFHSGGCSVLLTNKRKLKDRSLFKLKHTVVATWDTMMKHTVVAYRWKTKKATRVFFLLKT
ncbi:hypothetical protein V6N13_011290 [Hibiscus sabdariffa]|uniref:FAE domain-containing protein n=1 Tax=Hibiscus sabdariffa TaxID=183260 RepID=A0ABR2SBT3_9ROSI